MIPAVRARFPSLLPKTDISFVDVAGVQRTARVLCVTMHGTYLKAVVIVDGRRKTYDATWLQSVAVVVSPPPAAKVRVPRPPPREHRGRTTEQQARASDLQRVQAAAVRAGRKAEANRHVPDGAPFKLTDCATCDRRVRRGLGARRRIRFFCSQTCAESFFDHASLSVTELWAAPRALIVRRLSYGWDALPAFLTPPGQHEQSLDSRAREIGLGGRGTISKRIGRGWTRSRALTAPRRKTYPEFAEIAPALGLTRSALIKRLQLGWSYEKATTTGRTR